MRKGRFSFHHLPDANTVCVLCRSQLGAPWPAMEPDELAAALHELRKLAEFCRLRVLAFSLRPRSFDVLLEYDPSLRLSEKEIFARLETWSGAGSVAALRKEIHSGRQDLGQIAARKFGNPSYLMQRLKMAIGKIYHGKRGTFGEIWSDRYSSTFIEPGHASRVVAAWVDHGISRDNPGVTPGDHPTCTYGAAAAGDKAAREALGSLFSTHPAAKWNSTRTAWREFLGETPGNAKTRATTQEGTPPLTRAELMLHPVPAFGAGLAVGSRDFTARLFAHNRAFFKTAVRTIGPRFIIGQNDPELFALRDKGDLRKPPRAGRQKNASPPAAEPQPPFPRTGKQVILAVGETFASQRSLPQKRGVFRYFSDATSAHVLCHSAFNAAWPAMSGEELEDAHAILLDTADFCAMGVLSFSLCPRSFHLLLEVPFDLRLSRKEMFARMEKHFHPLHLEETWKELRHDPAGKWERLAANFGSVSAFMKRFKNNLGNAYYRKHGKLGGIWQSRYYSSFVEQGYASRVVAAWLDHAITRENPGTLPRDYPACTIGRATAGNSAAREMIRRLFSDDAAPAWSATDGAWQSFIATGPENPLTRLSNINRTPPLTRAELMLHPVPAFTTGLAVGSEDFNARLFELNRPFFLSKVRATGPRHIVGQNDRALFTLRDKGDLRKLPRRKSRSPLD